MPDLTIWLIYRIFAMTGQTTGQELYAVPWVLVFLDSQAAQERPVFPEKKNPSSALIKYTLYPYKY